MLPTTIRTITTQPLSSTIYTVKGWIKHRRISKNVIFISLHDGSTQHPLQIVADPKKVDEATRRELNIGASLQATGQLVASQGAQQSREMQATTIAIIGTSPSTYPLQPKAHTLPFLRKIKHMRFRSSTFTAINRLRHLAAHAVHDFLHKQQFLWIHTPIITNIDTEGAGDTFQVTSYDEKGQKRSFFDSSAHLTVSGQLAVEAAALGCGRVYSFGPTFRAENSNTTRHLAEFWMIEPEMAFYDLGDAITLAKELLQYVMQHLLAECPDEVGLLTQRLERSEEGSQSDLPLDKLLHKLSSTPFTQLTYTDALQLLQQAVQQKPGRFTYPVDQWGAPLQSEHEQYLTEYFEGVVVVTDYPADSLPFYMRQNEDGKTVAAMDILFPGIGEVVGGSQREERYSHLLAAMQAKQIDTDKMDWYLDTRRFGSVPHSGFGIGFERLLLFLTGMENIRDVIPYPRTPGHIAY